MQRAPTTAFGPWPDDRQRLLLEAVVWNDERALRSWDGWRAAVTPEQIDAGASRLLASAYRPLRRLGVDDPILSLAGGAYRRAWYVNQLALRRAADVICELRTGGIEVLLLKGAALSLLHYRDLGARPMEDVDLLVRPHQLEAAVEALHAHGWRALASQGPGNGPLKYGTHVVDARGNELDLHAYALMQSADDTDMWETRVPIELMATPAFALAPPEQLVHVCAHGLRWDETSTVRWVADAMAVLRSAGTAFDWERVVERAQARRLTVVVGQALAWLRESLDAEIPAWVLAGLRTGPRLRFERAIQEISTRPPTQLGFAVMSFDRYRRFAKLAPTQERPGSFARYLQGAWALDSASELLVHGGRKLAGRPR